MQNAHLGNLTKYPANKEVAGVDESLVTTIQNGELSVCGSDGGFVFFEDTEASYYRVRGTFRLSPNEPDLEPYGFSLILHGGEGYKGAPLSGEGIGINYDRYEKKIIVKRYPSDETIGVAFKFPESYPTLDAHEFSVEAKPDNEYTVYLDGKKIYTFHNFSYSSGMVGLRVWGNSCAHVTNLSVGKIQEPPKKTGETLYVISAGIGQFDDHRISAIPGAETDAVDIYNIFERFAGERTVRRILLKNHDAHRENVEYALSVLPQDGESDDILVAYLAGHGGELGNDKFYFLTSGTSISSAAAVQAKGILMKSLPAHIRAHDHGLKLLLLDTCHATGALPEGSTDGMTLQDSDNSAKAIISDIAMRSKNTIIFAATKKKSKGLFTDVFLEGLGGSADGYKVVGGKCSDEMTLDGRITAEEAICYTWSEVASITENENVPVVSDNFWRKEKEWVELRSKVISYLDVPPPSGETETKNIRN
ncbi:MAG: Caspase domain-containing protein [Candidatus Kentron sp. G]|nr:MAG: Caspase domain-containing protein [Candidatus Kentron sp. G]